MPDKPNLLTAAEIVAAIKDQYQYVVIVYDNERDFHECDGCNSEAPLSIFEHQSPSRRKTDRNHLLCELCASTPCGNAVSYPSQYPEVSTLKTINFGNNAILTNQGRFKQVEAIECEYTELETALKAGVSGRDFFPEKEGAS